MTLFLLHVTRWQPLICPQRLLDHSIYLMCLWITIAAPGPFVLDVLCSSGNTKRIRLPPAARGGFAPLLNLSILAPRTGSRCWFPLPAFPTKLRCKIFLYFWEEIFQGWNIPQTFPKNPSSPPFSDDTRWEEKFSSVPTGLIEPTSRPICLAWKLRGYGMVSLFGGQKP